MMFCFPHWIFGWFHDFTMEYTLYCWTNDSDFLSKSQMTLTSIPYQY